MYFASKDELTSMEAKKYCEARNAYVLLGQDNMFYFKQKNEIRRLKKNNLWRKLNW